MLWYCMCRARDWETAKKSQTSLRGNQGKWHTCKELRVVVARCFLGSWVGLSSAGCQPHAGGSSGTPGGMMVIHPSEAFGPNLLTFLWMPGLGCAQDKHTILYSYCEILRKNTIHWFKLNQTLLYGELCAISCWMICPATATREANEKWEECAGHLSSHISQGGFEAVCFLNFPRSMVTGDGCHHMCSFGKRAMVRLWVSESSSMGRQRN